ncbi:MAG TPA: hypothetical protein VFX65_12090 [Candidatus Limnocylindrales bacterium]|nr:hypothetical protein [Candidatus Limnocylindrales bacterium]
MAGCALEPPAPVPIATGQLGLQNWTASLGVSGDQLCVHVAIGLHAGDFVCGRPGSDLVLWRMDPGSGLFMVASTGDGRAASARVTFDGADSAISHVATAPSLTELRFFVVAVPAGPRPTRLEIIDAGDNVIDTMQFP